jgi:hypothetical protein
MEGAGAGPDLLESGGPEREGRWAGRGEPVGSPYGRPRPRLRRGLTWGVVGVVVAGYLGVQWFDSRTPVAPPIEVRQDRSPDSEPLWSPGVDGRPTSPLSLSVAATLSLKGRPGNQNQVTPLGLTGPGLTSPGVFPHMAVTSRPQSFDLTGQVACDKVTLPVSGTAYAMRVRVTSGAQSSTVDMPLPLAGSAVASRVTNGCSTWLATRDLTVASVAVTVDPARPHLQLTVQVTNTGSQGALVWLPASQDIGVHVSDVVLDVPAHASAQAPVTVDLDSCWTWDTSSAPLTTADTPVPLLGGVGLSAPLAADALPAVQGLNGLVLGPGVAATLQHALVEACGGVATPELATGVHSSRYVVATSSLTTTAITDAPSPAVSLLRFLPISDPQYDGPATPTYAPSPWLVPDAQGRVTWPLSYAIPPNIVCINGGGAVWVSTQVEAQVRNASGGTRIVTFRLAAEALLPAPQIMAACYAMDAAVG